MTREELEHEAEEYVSTTASGTAEEMEMYEHFYIAGAKAHQTQWHNLRKNPDDLPEDTYDVLDQAGYKVHYNFFQNVWENEKDEVDEHVIAWCEIPRFEE